MIAVQNVERATVPNSGDQPSLRDDWMREGERAFSSERYSEAELSFQKAAQLNPFHPDAHARLGSVYWRQGRIEDALNSLTRALELDPDHRESVMNCAEVLLSFGRREDAGMVLNSYCARHPEDEEARRKAGGVLISQHSEVPAHPAEFLTREGEAQYRKGNLDHARACFEMASEHDPLHAVALSNLATVMCRQGDAEGALETVYRALDLKPDDPDILYNSYEILKTTGHSEISASFLRIYLEKGYGCQEDWDAYDKLLRRLGLASWSPEGLSPEVAAIHSRMGQELCLAGDVAGGKEAFERALMISPKDPTVYLQVAETLAAGEMVEEAISICEEGLNEVPSNADLSSMLSQLLARRNAG